MSSSHHPPQSVVPELDKGQKAQRVHAQSMFRAAIADGLPDQMIAGRAIACVNDCIYEYILVTTDVSTASGGRMSLGKGRSAKRARTVPSKLETRWDLCTRVEKVWSGARPRFCAKTLETSLDFQVLTAYAHMMMCCGEFDKSWSSPLDSYVAWWPGLSLEERSACEGQLAYAVAQLRQRTQGDSTIWRWLPMDDFKDLPQGKAIYAYEEGEDWIWNPYYRINGQWKKEGSSDSKKLDTTIHGWNILAFHQKKLVYFAPLLDGRLWIAMLGDAPEVPTKGTSNDWQRQISCELIQHLIHNGELEERARPKELFERSRYREWTSDDEKESESSASDEEASKECETDQVEDQVDGFEGAAQDTTGSQIGAQGKQDSPIAERGKGGDEGVAGADKEDSGSSCSEGWPECDV